uniref:Uncharacterized protein n=1 Tax=Physcomitrium patens TaxID=3218 RepID=A0A2K1K4C7_PHYPA|nr:hypothetical protein PHYPA_013095 [Physcomitrium patens]
MNPHSNINGSCGVIYLALLIFAAAMGTAGQEFVNLRQPSESTIPLAS